MNRLVIPHDKALHAIWGALIFAVVAVLATLGPWQPMARGVGFGAAVLFGALKEAWDYLQNRRALAAGMAPTHGVEGSDLAWTAGGAAMVWIAAALTEPSP